MTSADVARAARAALLVSSLFACSSQPPGGSSTAEPADQPETPASPRILGACCPTTDSSIIALIQRYESTPASARPPELAILPYRQSSGFDQRLRTVVRDSATWATLWRQAMGSHSPKAPLPAMDFARDQLILVAMGTRSSGGYTIGIDSVFTRADTVNVVVRERSPGRTCGTTAALSEPVALARVTRYEMPTRYIERADTVRCE